mmetsp:Transcript_6892/g.11849  ORF Transcript_6892/g.11849 Transcript_6892/m.11849 type:complete len:146 (-) Transcript_6892:1500-1937(-)
MQAQNSVAVSKNSKYALEVASVVLVVMEEMVSSIAAASSHVLDETGQLSTLVKSLLDEAVSSVVDSMTAIQIASVDKDVAPSASATLEGAEDIAVSGVDAEQALVAEEVFVRKEEEPAVDLLPAYERAAAEVVVRGLMEDVFGDV